VVTISFDCPDECPNCGSHNWKVIGSVLNEGLNIALINLSCMRCRTTVHRASHDNNIENSLAGLKKIID
jgi:hypothetical protein